LINQESRKKGNRNKKANLETTNPTRQEHFRRLFPGFLDSRFSTALSCVPVFLIPNSFLMFPAFLFESLAVDSHPLQPDSRFSSDPLPLSSFPNSNINFRGLIVRRSQQITR